MEGRVLRDRYVISERLAETMSFNSSGEWTGPCRNLREPKILSVHPADRLITKINGRVMVRNTSMGAATGRATCSARCKANDLGTSSPRIT